MTAPPSFILHLFGPFDAQVAGESLPRPYSKKDRWLLALLALRSPRRIERSWLAGTLWPNNTEEQALSYLRMSLSRLRQELGSEAGRILSPSRSTLTLDLAGARVDVAAFDEALDRGDLISLQRAVELYRGPLLEGCTEDWILGERESRERACLKALAMLADRAKTVGDFDTAVDCLHRACRLDPIRESVHRNLIETLAASGDHAAATQIYRELRSRLHREMNAEPSPETQALFRRLLEGGEKQGGRGEGQRSEYATPSLPTSPAPRLPRPLTALIGRERETREVADRLSSTRLVTLVGAGGVGKTRLAIRAAEAVAHDHPDGVWFVDLAPVTDPERVGAVIVSALEMREKPGRPIVETLVEALQSRSLLLVLDNCEHLVDACASIVETLLESCPQLHILATSREVLRIPAETTYRVPSLATPDPESAMPAEEILAYDAMQLLLNRILAVSPSFALTTGSVEALAVIGRRLEGIPLALELAAVRTRTMSVEQIAERLGRALSLLSRGSRTAHSRQQTLRATLDWSYRLLSEEEQRLLRRLSVFAGGWMLDAAYAVGGSWSVDREPPTPDGTSERSPATDDLRPAVDDSRSTEEGTLDYLTGLVEKSLVTVEEGGGETRYRYLETVRQYATERLEEWKETGEARSRHLAYFMILAERSAESWAGPDQRAAMKRLQNDQDNVRAALGYALRTGGGETGLRLISAIALEWGTRRNLDEGLYWLEQMLDAPRSRERTIARAKALCAAGSLTWVRKSLVPAWEATTAASWLDEGIALSKALGDRQLLASVNMHRGMVAEVEGDRSLAKSLLNESLRLYEAEGDLDGQTAAYINLELVSYWAKSYDDARRYAEAGLSLARETGNSYYCSLLLSHLGLIARDEGDLTTARALIEQRIDLAREFGDGYSVAACLRWLGEIALRENELLRARELLEESIRVYRQVDWYSDIRPAQEVLEETKRRLDEEERRYSTRSTCEGSTVSATEI